MNIALVQSPIKKDDYLGLPVGILALASFFKKNNSKFTPLIIDLNILVAKGIIKYDGNFYRKAADIILENKPNIIGFSAMCTTLPTALLIAVECKKRKPESTIIFGGPDVSFGDIQLLNEFNFIDIIVRGEGEHTTIDLLNALKYKKRLNNIRGITFRNDGLVARNEDRPLITNLDILPNLDLSLLPHQCMYEYGQVEGGRGCPYHCAFCTTSKMWGRMFRMKSVRKYVREIILMQKHFPKSPVFILHDNPLFNVRRANEFLKMLKKKKVNFTCYARYDSLNSKTVKLLKEAGCKSVYIGIESASNKVMTYINKKVNIDNDKLLNLVELLLNNRIIPTLSFMMGFPEETEDDLNQTLLMYLKCAMYEPQPLLQLHPLTILKGSDLCEKVKPVHFGSSDISPIDTKLPVERDFIRKHPDLFPSYFSVENKHFSINELHYINGLYEYLSRHYPFTAMMLLDSMGLTPVQLAREMKCHHQCDQQNKSHRTYSYHDDIARFVGNKASNIIKSMYEFEILKQYLSSNNIHPVRNKKRITLNSKPMLAPGIVIANYDYDVLEARDKIRKGCFKISTNKCYLICIPGIECEVISIDSDLNKILKSCNGKKKVVDIIGDMYGTSINSRNQRRLISKFLSTMRTILV